MINGLSPTRGREMNQRRRFDGEVAEMQDAHRQEVEELRRSVEKILDAELARVREVAKALADLSAATRIKQKAGASKEIQGAVRWLEPAEGPAAKPKRAAPQRQRVTT